jgi:hypothetical protein
MSRFRITRGDTQEQQSNSIKYGACWHCGLHVFTAEHLGLRSAHAGHNRDVWTGVNRADLWARGAAACDTNYRTPLRICRCRCVRLSMMPFEVVMTSAATHQGQWPHRNTATRLQQWMGVQELTKGKRRGHKRSPASRSIMSRCLLSFGCQRTQNKRPRLITLQVFS